MNSRLAEQGVIGSNGQLTQAFSENKDLVSQYKTTDALKDNNSSSSAHHASSNGASPNSSEGSNRALPSPYSSLFEAAKANGFTPRYDPSSPHADKKDPGFAFHSSALPLSPVSPLSPLNPATRFFFQSAASLLGKNFNGVHKLYNGEMSYASAYQPRYLPLRPLNPVLKTSSKEATCIDLYGDVPEQEKPIDLTVKKSADSGDNLLNQNSKCSKHENGDQESDYSPNSSEVNNNTSPLDLTAKRTPEPVADENSENGEESDNEQSSSKNGGK
ncbi:nuclear receptor ROR-beta-like protein [Dinothrombium tinctorium]|uniref:Nuclear receptor ROR-beta-like protein n=1 Tax=Dinothrombium tinctorium TaxID=1965070 RepID=A0A443RMI6_9ACAR|nr:nuclear receptor ROR-beta-like protein [Dinothrombium tinctorium]